MAFTDSRGSRESLDSSMYFGVESIVVFSKLTMVIGGGRPRFRSGPLYMYVESRTRDVPAANYGRLSVKLCAKARERGLTGSETSKLKNQTLKRKLMTILMLVAKFLAMLSA